MANFEVTLVESSGEYFTWFADDDRYKATFIDDLLLGFSQNNRQVSAICLEAQYEAEDGLFPFFAEGTPFYGGIRGAALDRVRSVIQHGPGNIIYGLFRRESLFHKGTPVTRWIGKSLNELPLFALVAFNGNIVYLPEIGFWKLTPKRVCRQAMWEQIGGFSPRGPYPNLPHVLKYHFTVYSELCCAYDALPVPAQDKSQLKALARRNLASHALAYFVGWKPRRKQRKSITP